MTDINRADQYENCTPANVDDPMPISPFLTTTDVINQLNKQLSSLSYDECKDDCNADNDTDGNNAGFELQKRLPDGSAIPATPNETLAADFKTKVEQSASFVSKLNPQDRRYWAEKQRQTGNAFFRKKDYSSAIDIYLTCLVVKEENNPDFVHDTFFPVLNNLSQCCLKLGMHTKNIVFCEMALNEASKLAKETTTSAKYNSEEYVVEHNLESVPVDEGNNQIDSISICKILFKMAKSFRLTGNYIEAKEALDNSLSCLAEKETKLSSNSPVMRHDDDDNPLLLYHKAIKKEYRYLAVAEKEARRNRKKLKYAMRSSLEKPDNDRTEPSPERPLLSDQRKGLPERRTKPIYNSLFETTEHGITLQFSLVLLGVPLLLSGQILWGGCLTVLALIVSASKLIIKEAYKHKLYAEPKDIVTELDNLQDIGGNEEYRIKYCVERLSILGQKYDKKSERKNGISLLYQQYVYVLLRLYPENDQIIDESMSLLALIAANKHVRKRFKYDVDNYGLDMPINVLRKALNRAKKEDDEATTKLLAEILRKGCLWLGAVCNDDKEGFKLSSIIASNGGLNLILEVGTWFRLNQEVSNWVLWSAFTLCYDQIAIKKQFIKKQGLQTICTLMENNPSHVEVNRHGVALLFDILRESQRTDGWEPLEIMNIALSSGLHKILLSAMNEFSDSMDIMMMSREILIGTGHIGSIPSYQHS